MSPFFPRPPWRAIAALDQHADPLRSPRTNVSVARQAGMATDLALTVGDRYSIITLVFFIPYIIFELPSNILLRKVGCKNLLSGIAVAWGAVVSAISLPPDRDRIADGRFFSSPDVWNGLRHLLPAARRPPYPPRSPRVWILPRM